MKFTWQRIVRTGLLLAAGLSVAALIGQRFGLPRPPGRSGFGLVILLVAAPTVFWWAWLDERLANGPPPDGSRGDPRLSPSSAASRKPRRRRMLRFVLGIYTAAVLAPVAMLVSRFHTYDALPVPVTMWVVVWHLSMALGSAVGLVFWVPWLALRELRRLIVVPADFKRSVAPDPQSPSIVPASSSPIPSPTPRAVTRRTLLTGAMFAAPTVLAASGVAGGLRQQGRFLVRRVQIRVPRLPDRLQGLTITHLSDLHVGRFFRPEHLPRVVDAVNRLDSDLIAITGDTVDHSIEFMQPACDAFQQMRSRHGRFIIVGNHDLIDSPDEAVQYLASREPNLLIDRHTTLDIGGEHIQIGGLPWPHRESPKIRQVGYSERTQLMLTGADPGLFTLVLTHHPHTFDLLADAGADLVLAGHTHGGQIMFTPQGSPHPIGGGNILFRYIWGEYRRGRSALYVSAGVGNWFPVRINAPAEIVQIQLLPMT